MSQISLIPDSTAALKNSSEECGAHESTAYSGDSAVSHADSGDADSGDAKESKAEASFPSKVSAWLLGGLLYGMCFLQIIWGGMESQSLRFQMGECNQAAATEGQWQRIFSAAWLHGSIAHLNGSVGTLLIFTLCYGAIFGVGWMLTILLLGATTAFALEACIYPGVYSYGMSSGIWALAGASMATAVSGARHYSKSERESLGTFVAIMVLFNFLVFFQKDVSHIGHLTGFVVGVIVGSVLCHVPRNARIRLQGGHVFGFGLLAISLTSTWDLWSDTKPWTFSNVEVSAPLVWKVFDKEIRFDVPPGLSSEHTLTKTKTGNERIVLGHAAKSPITFSVVASPALPGDESWEPPLGHFETNRKLRNTPVRTEANGQIVWYFDLIDANNSALEYPRWIIINNALWIDMEGYIPQHTSKEWRRFASTFVDRISVHRAAVDSPSFE